jgi:hypothetical protein
MPLMLKQNSELNLPVAYYAFLSHSQKVMCRMFELTKHELEPHNRASKRICGKNKKKTTAEPG